MADDAIRVHWELKGEEGITPSSNVAVMRAAIKEKTSAFSIKLG